MLVSDEEPYSCPSMSRLIQTIHLSFVLQSNAQKPPNKMKDTPTHIVTPTHTDRQTHFFQECFDSSRYQFLADH
jgi:hypothetical protein